MRLLWGAGGRRGGMTLTMALATPALVALIGLVVDTGFWVIAESRLQVAADAAAMADMLMLQNTTAQASTPGQMKTYLANNALFEAQAAATKLAGTIAVTQPVSYDATAFSWVQVKLTSTPISLFANFIPSGVAPSISATSRASLPAPAAQPCAVALGPGINQTDNGTGNVGILLLASATLSATNCEVWSNVASPSNADYSIMALASGAVTAKQIGANGNFGPSGQTTITASSGGPGPNKGTVADPFAGWTKPTDPGTCVNPASSGQTSGAFNQLSASYTTSAASPTTFCGDATHTWAWRPSIGRTVTFGPGVYYFVNTNATFQNQGGTITFGSGGVSFVFLGRGASGTAMVGNLKWSAGNFTWTPNSDSAYGISYLGKAFAIVQLCDSPNVTTYQQMTMSQSSIVTMNDAVYLPCGEFQVTGTAQVKPPLGSNLSVVAASFGLSQTSAGAALTVSAAASAAGTLSLQPTQ